MVVFFAPDSSDEARHIYNIQKSFGRVCQRALSTCTPLGDTEHNHEVYKLVVVEEVGVEVGNDSDEPERKRRRVVLGEREVLKGVLVAWSPIFATMLSERWDRALATNDKRVEVKGYTLEVVDLFIHFLYNGDIAEDTFDKDNLPSLLMELSQMGQYYHVDELQLLCVTVLSSLCYVARDARPSFKDLKERGYNLFDIFRFGGAKLIAQSIDSIENNQNNQNNQNNEDLRDLATEVLQVRRRPPCDGDQRDSDNANIMGYDAFKRFMHVCGGPWMATVKDMTTEWRTLYDNGWKFKYIHKCGVQPWWILQEPDLNPMEVYNAHKQLIDGPKESKEVAAISYVFRERVPRFEVSALKAAGWTSEFLQCRISDSHILIHDAGYSFTDLLDLGYKKRFLERSFPDDFSDGVS